MNTYRTRPAAGLAGRSARIRPLRFCAAFFALMLGGCSSSVKNITATVAGPRLYLMPVVYGGNTITLPATYSIDDKGPTFVQETYAFSDTQSGGQIQYSGTTAALARGLLDLTLTYACGTQTTNGCTGTSPLPSPPNGWAMELADQNGGLVQLTGQPFTPLVPAVACPSMKSAETFLFVTLPTPLSTAGKGQTVWDPQLETAYGSVDISASGSTVVFANIKQSLLPSAGGGTPSDAPTASVTGAGGA